MSGHDISNIEWLSKYLKLEVTSVEARAIVGAGGLNSELQRAIVTFINSEGDDETMTVILKTVKGEKSIQLGMPREAHFYSELANKLELGTPKVYYSYGDMESGFKAILMEDLSDCIQSGYFFGAHSPHNWGKDLDEIISKASHVTALEICKKSFTIIANINSLFWMDESLLELPWLRASAWIKGNFPESFKMAQDTALNGYNMVKQKLEKSEYTVKWDPYLLKIIEASLSKISWETYQNDIKSRPWTLVHGDFHPANTMLRVNSDKSFDIFVLDFEMVGLGSGPQDIAQYIISHASRDFRLKTEDELVRFYYNELISANNNKIKDSGYSFEDCYKEYIFGGTERWIWLLILIANLCPDNLVQYFHDQVLEFVHDHPLINENTIGMPRV